MSLDLDDELLQDFLVEAGEILEQLNEQLVELEQRPSDTDLLNTVFRGFHTIKGGAGFLCIEAMVELCHRAEDVFNLLRNGEREVNTGLMDAVLPVIDVLNDQFDTLRAGEQPGASSSTLLQGLDKIISGEDATQETSQSVNEPATSVETETPIASGSEGEAAAGDDITDEQFDAILDALQNPDGVDILDSKAAVAIKPETNDITDEEFEDLLDDLHGSNKISGASKGESKPKPKSKSKSKPKSKPKPKSKSSTKPSPDKKASTAQSKPQAAADDEITEDEFEALLDELHGKGKHGHVDQTAESKTAKESSKELEGAKTPPINKEAPVTQGKRAKPSVEDKTVGNKAGATKDKSAIQAEASVRVDTKRLDDIMNMVGELVLVRNRITRLGGASSDEEMLKAVANLDVVTADLQLSVMKTRMQPIKKVFGRFPRVVRDLARSLSKEIKLEMQGEETDLDKNLVEALADPLVHLVRNAVDHGIEMPDEREKAGKLRSGTVLLAAEQEGDHILLTIEDDGKGMDANVLRKKVVEKGLMDADAAARMSDNDCYALIFMPGFSTKNEISDISGRGVGMDVVKTRIAQLNGSVEVDSKLGRGTRLSIKVPLTLAIMPTLMVRLDEQLFALPLVSVNEIFHLNLTNTSMVDGQLVILIRERTLPLFYLSRWLIKCQANADLPSEGHVVVVHVGTQRVGFVVDELIGQEEVVIKPLGAMLHGTLGLAGATITGDGSIALILDIAGLMRSYA